VIKLDVNSQEKVYAIPIDAIDDFPDFSFQVKDDEKMEQLVRIDNNGVRTPIIVRPDGARDELIAGHRRRHAWRTLGIKTIPTIVRELSREEAVVEIVASNL
jgi:ParB family chromosome partitioning protein